MALGAAGVCTPPAEHDQRNGSNRDGIDDHIGAAGGLDELARRQPAGRVAAVAEEEEQRAARIGFAQRQRRKDGIEERRGAAGGNAVGERAQPRPIAGQSAVELDALGKRQERGTIVSAERRDDAPQSFLEMPERHAGDAAADVEAHRRR